MAKIRAKVATRSEKESRIKEIYGMLVNSKFRPEILEYSSNNWNLSRAATDVLIQAASNIIKEDLEKSREAMLVDILRKQERIYVETMSIQNHAVARQVLMDKARLIGADKQKIVHSMESNDPELVNIDDDAISQELISND